MKTLTYLWGLGAITPFLLVGPGCNAIAGISQAQEADESGADGCIFANDGHCDEPEFCPPGTDTTDCGGDDGTVGITPVESGCATDPQIDESLIRGCLLRVSCDPLAPPYSISQCVTFSAQTFGGTEFCTYRADTCADVEGCLGRRFLENSECDGAPDGWSCDGNLAKYCGTDSPLALECEAMGATCLDEEGSLSGSMGPCAVEPFDCTDKTDGEFYCDGDVLYTCEDGISYSQDCREKGDICTELNEGEAYCNSRTTTCTDPGVVECSGDRITQCDANGFFQSYDCATAGGHCEQDGSSVAYCLAEGCTKDDECIEECTDNTTLRMCQGASPIEIDCEAFGFTGCQDYLFPGGTTSFYSACVGGGGPDVGEIVFDDSCKHANDGVCDEPLYCTVGSDDTDCSSARGTCGNGSENWEGDGKCDVPLDCERGSDVEDCETFIPVEQCCYTTDPCEIEKNNQRAGASVCVCPDMSWNAAECAL